MLDRVLEGFKLHPYFFILENNADPPVLPYAHQVELLLRLAVRRPVRALVADEIGLGKTIEAVLAVRLLEKNDEVSRVLFLVPRILVEQWRAELKRFGIEARRIERGNIDRHVAEGFQRGWYIASVDLVKRREYRDKILSGNWDVIVVDEAHRVGYVGNNPSQRYIFVKELAKRNRHLILLSATPHRGHVRDYLNRLSLVDPYLLVSDELDRDDFYRLTRDSVVFRRTKLDVNEVYERKKVFRDARFVARIVEATDDEREFNRRLYWFLREKLLQYHGEIGEEPKGLPLLLALVAKRASSSPYAAMLTFERILQRRARALGSPGDEEIESFVEAYFGGGFEDYEDVGEGEKLYEPDYYVDRFVDAYSELLGDKDREHVRRLFELSKAIYERGDSRLRAVLDLVRLHLERGDNVVVFTEYKDTARYVFEKARERFRDVGIALVTSDGVEVGGDSRKRSIEDLKQLLRRGAVRLIISTDVASEGLNLQVANVVVHYEPSWSPVKIEQRIGRVWRLGQLKDVYSYTVFLAVESDRDVMDVLYKKLLAWGRSLNERRMTVGEEVEINLMTERGPVTIPLDIEKGTPKYSEFKAVMTYIKDGRRGLEEYVNTIVSALENLRKSLEKVGLSRRDLSSRVNRLFSPDIMGDYRGEAIPAALTKLLRAVALLVGEELQMREGRLYIRGLEVRDVRDVYLHLKNLVSRAKFGRVVISRASLDDDRELYLYRVDVSLRVPDVSTTASSTMAKTASTPIRLVPVFSEVVGVAVSKDGKTRVLRGSRLFEALAEALAPENFLVSIEESRIDVVANDYQQHAISRVKELINYVSKDFIEYMRRLENSNFSNRHKDWRPVDVSDYVFNAELIGLVIFSAGGVSGGSPPTPEEVREVERRAMEVAIEYEKSAGRVPVDVSDREHYDIESVDPKSGEVRYIEVKGKGWLDLEVELTEHEFNVAREKGRRYWLYIVYGIRLGKPRLLAVSDPVNSIRWREVSLRRYKFSP